MTFSFGAPAAAAAGPPPPATPAAAPAAAGFSFGGAPANATPAPVAAAAGLSFGGAAPAAEAPPAFGTAPAAAAAPAFGAPPPAAQAPAFGATAPAAATNVAPPPIGTTVPATPNNNTAGLSVPDYSKLFPDVAIATRIQQLLRDNNRNSNNINDPPGELAHLLSHSDTIQTVLAALTVPTHTAGNMQLRQRLSTVADSRTVFLEATQKQAYLTDAMLHTVFQLSDDLRLSEEHALSLYAAVLASKTSTSKPAAAAASQMNVAVIATDFYFQQRAVMLQTVLQVLQHCLSADGPVTVVPAVCTWLKQGLVQVLVQLVRASTQQAHELQQQQRAQSQSANIVSPPGQQQQIAQPSKAVQKHYEFAVAQRQTATECLFFIAYHSQLLESEICLVVDLIQELVNGTATMPGLLVLDPLQHIPDAFENHGNQMQQAPTSWFGGAQQEPNRPEKDLFKWQAELVQQTWDSGQPVLLRCVSTLTVTVVSALDTRNVLVDRQTAEPNTFTGNQLLPPHSPSTEGIMQIHNRLAKDAVKNWKRPDIFGVLATALGLLLRTSPSALASPRSGPAGGGHNMDVRKSWRECLEAPVEHGSFSTARLTLLPALQKPDDAVNSNCQVQEFFTMVLADFCAQYLQVLGASGERPISRAKWEQEAQEEVRLNQSHQEQRRDFSARVGAHGSPETVVPKVVDLLKRPDCMDDVIALAVTICSLGSDYALRFWSQEDVVGEDDEQIHGNNAATVKLVPSRALRELERLQREDDSMRPSFLSFLAVLALAESPVLLRNGAAVVHDMLSTSDPNLELGTDWASLVDILRWYLRELSSQAYGSTSGASSSTASTSSGRAAGTSTAYYYHADRSVDGATYGSSRERSQTDGTSARSKPRELCEDNTFILLSHLAIIGNVASRSAAARAAILSVNLPIQSPDGTEVVGQDSALMVLFMLVGVPLSPDIRGAVFETIANILQTEGSSDEDCSKMRDVALKGWELLEACQVLPIHLLDQYPSIRESDAQGIPGLAFPPSSTALVKDTPGKSWIPVDSRYAIVYEMEYIESATGCYPSTGGFLRLLHALFSLGGSPGNLGENWRVRCGCTPYIEYVVHLVLPRVTGRFPHLRPLPFRSLEDKSRLTSLALAVVETVVATYAIPAALPTLQEPLEKTVAKSCRDTRNAAREKLGHRALADTVTVTPTVDDVKLFIDDFRSSPAGPLADKLGAPQNSTASVATNADQWTTGMSAVSRSMAPPVPRAKSPGFALVAEMLSSSGELFSSIASILVCNQSIVDEGLDADKIALVFSLFGSTPPKYASAKAKSGLASSSPSRQSLLKPLRPGVDSPSYSCAVNLREQCVLGVLRILCGVLSREDLLSEAMSAVRGNSSMAPVLHFRNKSTGPSRLKVVDLQLSRVANSLLSLENGNAVLSSVIDFVGYTASSSCVEVDLAAAAVGILFYVGRSQRDFGFTCRVSAEGSCLPARSFARRLLSSSERCGSLADAHLLRLILDRILEDIRIGFRADGSFARIALGLPATSANGAVGFRNLSVPQSTKDCFDALLRMLDETQFIVAEESAELASRCFETLFRVCELTQNNEPALQQAVYATNRLRAVRFWNTHLTRMLSTIRQSELSPLGGGVLNNQHVVHSIAWILKGAAIELQQLLGKPGWPQGSDALGGSAGPQPQPSQYKDLVSLLFAPPLDFVVNLLQVMPVEKNAFDAPGVVPSEAAVRGAKYALPGAHDVVQGYEMINGSKLVELMQISKTGINEQGLLTWANQWNESIARECAAAHLSSALHIVLGSAFASKEHGMLGLLPDAVDGHRLLTCLLARFERQSTAGSRYLLKLDDALFTTATRNLALASLVTTEYVVSRAGRTPEGSSNVDGPAACALLARAVVSSGYGTDLSPNSSRTNERTAILTTALAVMLQHLSKEDVRDTDLQHFFRAAVVVSRLASARTDTRIPAVPSTEALVARSCLSLLLELFGSDTDGSRAQSPVQAVLVERNGDGISESPIKTLVRLVASLDGNVAIFLQKVAHLPFGADVLLESGVLKALQAAAECYKAEELRVQSSHRNDVAYENVSIVTPSFLQGHLGLMSTLMATRLSSDRGRDLPLQVMKILRVYASVFERLVSRFPMDGDVLQSCFRCIAQAQSWGASSTSDVLCPLPFGGLLEAGALVSKEFDRAAVVLTMHIAENPFPSDTLPALPSLLSERINMLNNGAVAMTNPKEKSWWDALNVERTHSASAWLRSNVRLTDETFDYSILGADMLGSGFCLIRGAASTSLLDESTLSRALCRCVHAVRMIDAHMQSSSSDTWGRTNAGSRNWKLLRSKWENSATELLLVLLKGAREANREANTNQFKGSAIVQDGFGKQIIFALDHTSLDSSGIAPSRQGSVSDENRPDYAIELARALRKECSQRNSHGYAS